MGTNKRAAKFALFWWRGCKRPDLTEEDKVHGAIMRYQEFIDVDELFKECNMAEKKDCVDVYLATIARIEPEITSIDRDAFYASAAISLKRIADSLEQIAKMSSTPQVRSNSLSADDIAELRRRP